MHSIKWQCFRWPWVTPNPSQEWLKLELSNVVQSETMSSLAKGAWLCNVIHLSLGAPSISHEWLKLELSNFVHWFARWRFTIVITNCPLNGRGHVFKFLEISDNILETVQDRDIVTMEVNYEIISNGMVEWIWRSLLLSETFGGRRYTLRLKLHRFDLSL